MELAENISSLFIVEQKFLFKKVFKMITPKNFVSNNFFSFKRFYKTI